MAENGNTVDLVKLIRPSSVDVLFRKLSEAYGDGRLVFRGQADAKWTLYSSFDRLHAGNHVKREQDFGRLLEEYKSLMERHFGIKVDGNQNNIASFGQHLGLPTRLLDWSYSPFIGLFFCIYDNPSLGKQDSALFALDREIIETNIHSNNFEFIDPDTKNNSNLVRQQGCLSRIKTRHTDIESLLKDMKDEMDDPIPIEKYIIKKNWLSEIWVRLNAMNLNHISLVEGKESISKKLKTDIALSIFEFTA